MKRSLKSYSYWIWPSPVGQLLLLGDGRCLSGLHFQDGAHPLDIDEEWQKQRSPFEEVIKQLEKYFARQLQTFTIPLDLEGTGFQRSVWHALQAIPYGVTASYGAIAKKIRNPKASRAVGAANGQNPVAIIVPCHRVIGANGTLVGYGGGMPIKEFLLELEHRFVTTGSTKMNGPT
jgi:methylated-DNA-[protein]-cysteine S-methyltransferase